jgi:AraC-like DNA-binding protein
LSRQHPYPWHRGSEFGDGLRWPLDREQRCVWRVRLDLARRAGRITPLHVLIGLALLRRLGQDGRCDPSHDTIAADTGCSPRTVRTALAALFQLGMLKWVNRLVRVGARVAQASNAYTLLVATVAAFGPRPRRVTRCATTGGKSCRGTSLVLIEDALERSGALAALAAVRVAWEARRAG